MLRFLRITRLAVIDAVDVEFEAGFNVLTGETGAGKSILVEAVGLLLGGRASGDLVRTGEEVATVEAIFQTRGEEIIIRREVTAQGRSRAFVNGALVTAGALKDLAGGLIELHGQHEHQTLLDPSTHLTALDAFGNLQGEAAAVREAFAAWRVAEDEVQSLKSAASDRESRHDLAAFQLGELERAGITPGEDDELAATRQVLANAARIEQLCVESYAALYDSDQAVLSVLGGVWRRVADLAALDPAFETFLGAREPIKAQLEDLAIFLRRYADTLDVSPGRLQQVEERLSLLERLKRKYGPTLAAVIERRDSLACELEALQDGGDRLSRASGEAARLREQFVALATQLSGQRHKAAKIFAPTIVSLLADLALEHTQFEIRFNPAPLPDTEWSPLGVDRAEFYVSPNPGEDLRPLARIVSGGELSRVMLALKTMTFDARQAASREENEVGRRPGVGAPGMIFDEVDAGIGGRVADVVGKRLRTLGSTCQVLCITHLPQVASHADTHFLIEKRIDGNRTRTHVVRLDAESRVDEVVRMLAGASSSEAVRASAREMLARAPVAAQAKAKGESKSKGESESPQKARTRKDRRGA
jgi:DNA repair protein RecN (Recombination protein N)